MYRSTKTYDGAGGLGFPCAFRQWKAESHCKYIHGYALGFKFVFESEILDVRNWVVDFGGLKDLRQILKNNFDHTTIVSEDDPELEWFAEARRRGLVQLIVMPAGGCEKFAEYIYEIAEQWLKDAGYGDRVRLVSVEVTEHGANSAIFFR